MPARKQTGMITCDALTIKFYRIMFDKFYFLNNGDV